ncbi:hypothetical protein RE432_14785 [Pusillimonas sp. SM2304]|uniref:hypothetical protein n=1 Tax=Pusillimonas sp. SM2304 TaxID=3073241 RepID=UPI0028743531|nr:hypothetical protein [Pusillimonas sp. SM2304]MDS1141705.1 hypothetical protein [Pusillimonas sp. SM2304]
MRNGINAFVGMQPRVEPHLLPPGAAQTAVDARLVSGSIDTYRKPAEVTTLAKVGTIKTIYRFGKSLDTDTQHWFHWLNDTDVTRGSIPDDTQERTYFTEAGQAPRVTDSTLATGDALMPTASYLLGIPAASSSAAVTVTPGPDDPDGNMERQQCLLAYTFVSEWGEEGPPNAVSDPFNAATGDTLNVVSMEGPPSGAYNITHKRLYVSITDSMGSAVLRFWKEITAGATTYSAELDMTVLGEAVPENAMVPPPATMFGIMAHPGGFLIGFDGQRVLRSETFKPHGWPYFSPVADDIVGGAILGAATVICTKGGTYMATQADPITFTPIQLNGWQPCVSKRSIAILESGVVYASPDGLVGVDGTGQLSVLTATIMTRDQWQAYKPDSMMAVTHDGRIFLFYDTGTSKGGIILETVPGGGVQMFLTSIHATAAFADERRDALFLVVENGKLHKWDSHADVLTFTYTGKQFIAERPQNVGAAMVVADGYPLTFKFDAVVRTDTGDRTISFTKTVTSARPFRLDGRYRVREYQYTITSQHKVTAVTLASTLGNITAE